MLRRRDAQQFHALGITGHAGQNHGIHQRSHAIGRSAHVKGLDGGTLKNRFRLDALILHGAHHPTVECGIDRWHRSAHLKRTHHSPKPRSFLTGLVLNLLDQVGSILGVFGAEAHFRDLHQIRGKLLGAVPVSEHVGHLRTRHAAGPFHQVVPLGKDLLDPVFDAVVDGLHKMAGTTWADVGDTGSVVDLSRHFGDQAFDRVVRSFRSTRHHARAFKRSFGAAGHTHSDETEALAFQLGDTTFGVVIFRVSSIDQQITLLK